MSKKDKNYDGAKTKPWYLHDEVFHWETKGWECPTCKEVLPSGIVGISAHWADCGGKGFHDALIKSLENGKLDFEK